MLVELSLNNLPMPLRIHPAQPLSDEAFRSCAEENEDYRLELEPNGDLLVMSPAGMGTGRRNSRVSRFLDTWAELDARGDAYDSSTGFKMPTGAVRSADASWLSHQRAAGVPLEQRETYASVCPEFVIELRSPSDALSQQQTKMEEWIANGTQLGWLVDPQRRAVIIYRPDREPESLDNLSQVAGEGPVAGFVLPLDRIFI